MKILLIVPQDNMTQLNLIQLGKRHMMVKLQYMKLLIFLLNI